MQSVCSNLEGEYGKRVLHARTLICEDPVIGAIYDPPFTHFTHQLAEDYDWDGLVAALTGFAGKHQPFQARTTGLAVFTGTSAGVLVAVHRSQLLLDYHRELWDTVLPFARGRVDPFYELDNIVPHITIKRCGADPERFGLAMSKLAPLEFRWDVTIDNVMVMCDPAQNSLTHYQRICLPLGEANRPAPPQHAWNADVIDVTQGPDGHDFSVKLDNGGHTQHHISAPAMALLMAEARASWVYFAGGRCHVQAGSLVAVEPKTPEPIVY